MSEIYVVLGGARPSPKRPAHRMSVEHVSSTEDLAKAWVGEQLAAEWGPDSEYRIERWGVDGSVKNACHFV